MRAAAAQALGRVGTDAALERAAALARSDASARVRRAALRAFLARRPLAGGTEDAQGEGDPRAALSLAAELLRDPDPGVREEAAVALGVRGVDGAAAPLIGALSDERWEVAVAAAVSLGKTRLLVGVEPLAALALDEDQEDWRLRGAAVVGLGHMYRKEAVPHVIAALADADALVRRTAQESLASLANRDLGPEPDPWREWWEKNEKRISLADPAEEKARRERYGYALSTTEIYAGVDLFVLASVGDHLERVLADLGIEHSVASLGGVAEAGVHPRAIFAANCTGEVDQEDAERLAWFVRTGGHLFGSCWALELTIARVAPGVIDRQPTSGEVLGDVPAEPCTEASPYISGVFGPDVQPIYALEGAYLIRVLEPERCEVLIDSPACLDLFGGGNLCAWMRVGHGVALASANHFEEQGLARASSLKSAEDRQAFAVDHMGLALEDLRSTRGERYWKKATDAARAVKDLSVFRLITNFVREKRAAGEA